MARQKRFTPQELSGFCGQVAIMLKSGIGLEEGMYMLAEEVDERSTKHVLEELEGKLKESGSFEDALRETKAFPEYMINMVRIGERSGKLEEVMNSLARYYQREDMIKDSIRNVIAYPMMMFGMIAIILLALVGRILPMFESVFVNLNVDAASSSSRIMNFGMWAGRCMAGVAVVVLLVGVALYLWYHTASGRKALRGFVSSFFATKKTAGLLATGRFVSSMEVMVSSGLDTKEAMELAEAVVEHKGLQKKLLGCLERMDADTSFSDVLKDEKILTGMQGRMVAVADKAGLLEEVLGDLSRQYDELIADQLGQFCMRLETSLVLALSAVVGGVLISVMFPLVSIITSIG